MPATRFHIVVSGRVQGVGFRHFTRQAAASLGLSGWVRNRGDGTVEIDAQGETEAMDTFLAKVRKGPALAHVNEVTTDTRKPHDTDNGGFSVRH